MAHAFVNNVTGEISAAPDDSDVTEPSPEQSGPALLFDGEPTPAATPPTDAGPMITRERMVQESVGIATLAPVDALAEYDRRWLAWEKDPQLGDDRTPAGRAFREQLDGLLMRGKGLAPEDNHLLGVMHGDRMRPLEAETPGTYQELPAAGVVADRVEQDAAMSFARNLGGESVAIFEEFRYAVSHLYASGAPPDDIALHQQLTARWPTPAARQAIEGRLTDLYTALDRMFAEEGLALAQRERWRSELVRIEDYGVRGIEYLLGPFAQSLWDRGPAAFERAYASVQSEALKAQQLRAAKARQAEAAEGDEARAASLTEVAATHQRWRRSAP